MLAAGGGLVDGLYDCPADPRMWRQTLDQICQRFDVRSAAIQVLRRKHALLEQEWCVRDSYSHAHRAAHDRFVNNASNPRLNLRLARGPMTGITRDASTFAPNCPQLRQLRSNLAQVGLGTHLGAAAELSDDVSVCIVLHRRLEDDRDYGPEHEHLLLDLLPHVRRAVGLTLQVERLKAHNAALERTLDQLQTGVLVCSDAGQVRWANDAAQSLLSRSPRLRLAEARLRCAHRDDASAITAMFAGREDGEAVQLGGAEDEDSLHLLSKRLSPHEPDDPCGSEPMTAVFVTGAAKGGILSPDVLRKLFGLTPTEAQLTMALCEGASVNDYARERGVAVGTVRIQMKRLLAKTRCHRQADLVRRVLTSAAAQALLPAPRARISHLGVVATASPA
jgi:DNA-binding CsgD family transcriptional regulator/PAS domain-containing protein